MLARTILIAALLAASAARADPVPSAVYLQPQQLVTVQPGRHLNLYCTGHGSPTVLLDAGLGDSMLVWRLVQGEIAKTTRTCSYDRAGLGFSDPGPEPRDAEAAVSDIHQLLASAHLATPILYVGHSISGLYGLLLQARHPDAVAGEVLVDPAFAGQFEALSAPLPPQVRASAIAFYAVQFQGKRDCLAKAEKGEPVVGCASTTAGPQVLDDTLKTEAARQVAQPSHMRTDISEFRSFLPGDPDAADEREMRDIAPPFGDKPLAILTRTIPGLPFSPEQNAQLMQVWSAHHDGMAKLSSRGSNVLVPGSGHYIQIDQPQAVIDTVNGAITSLRER
jgi:pimeloyl-ACP methyl ester carboxylesterase